MKTKIGESRDSKQGARLFSLGQVVTTHGAMDALQESHEPPSEFLVRHIRGDWGELCEEDRQVNEEAVKEGFRILSSYRTNLGVKIWVITEADRSSTCLLLPSEY